MWSRASLFPPGPGLAWLAAPATRPVRTCTLKFARTAWPSTRGISCRRRKSFATWFHLEPGFVPMDERTLHKALSNIPLGGLRYFEKTGSTNDVALAWAADGAPDLALVFAGAANRRARARQPQLVYCTGRCPGFQPDIPAVTR